MKPAIQVLLGRSWEGAQTVPTEAGSSIPTVMDLTALDTGSMMATANSWTPRRNARRRNCRESLSEGMEIGVGGWWTVSAQSRILITVLHRIWVKRVCLGQSHMVKIPWTNCRSLSPNAAFRNLDVWNQEVTFSRAHITKTVPSFLRGGFRAALGIALDEVIAGWAHRDVTQQEGLEALLLFATVCFSSVLVVEGRFRGRNWRIVFKRSSLASGTCSSALQTTKVPGRRGWP